MTTLLQRYEQATMHNFLVHTPLNLNLLETRLFALALACIHKNHQELPPIVIKFSDAFAVESGSNYERLTKACESLMSKVVKLAEVNSKRKVTELYNIIDFMHLDSGTGLIVGTFSSKIAPYLIALTNNFTTVEVEMLLTLKSPHTHRLVWLLKSHEFQGGTEITVGDLRKHFFGEEEKPSYPDYFEFKRKVIGPALAEINDKQGINWQVTSEEIKAGLRRVIGLRFTIPTMPPTTRAVAAKEKKSKRSLKPATPAQASEAPVLRVVRDEPIHTMGKTLPAGVSPQLQLAYENMLKVDLVSKSVAQKILKLVAGSEAKQKILFNARFEVAGEKINDFAPGYTRAAHIVKAMKTIGLVLD